MNERVIKPRIQQEKDQQVPDFGGYKSWELKPPIERPIRKDAFNKEAQKQLYQDALNRALFFAYGHGQLPYVYFPNAEHFQHIPFTKKHWEQYGNMESEYAKVHFMLDNYQSRGFPVEFGPFCEQALGQQDMLGAWDQSENHRQHIAVQIYQQISQQMHSQREIEPLQYHNGFEGAYQSEPIFYQSSERVIDLEKQLWLKGLSQISQELQEGNTSHVKSFLELYNRMKDPITCLQSNSNNQAEIFLSLYSKAVSEIPQEKRGLEKDTVLIAQLAVESSFLALPIAKEIFAVIYGKHHELPYVYLDLAKLPRGELANPKRVKEVMEDILCDAQKYDAPVVTPIMVSFFQEPNKPKPELGILDGNNRATSVLLFTYLDSVEYDESRALDKGQLDQFVRQHKLAIAWERDLALALKEFSQKDWKLIQRNKAFVKQFAHSLVPALLVQEQNFDTIAVAKSNDSHIVLLQPMHQAMYNQRELPMAIPSKQQSHGRTEANDIRIQVKENV